MKISFTKNGQFIKNYVSLEICDLKDVFNYCTKIPKEYDGKKEYKGTFGAIFAPIMTTFYPIDKLRQNEIMTDGAMFCDIDHCEDISDEIISNIEKLNIKNLYAIWKSFSGNLHLCFNTGAINAQQYENQEVKALLYFALKLKWVLGITLTEDQIDIHNKRFNQRFYLNRIEWNSSIKLYDHALNHQWDYDHIFAQFDDDVLNEIKETWPHLYDEVYKVKYLSDYAGEIIVETTDYIDGDIKTERIKIDRNFDVNGFKGNDLRWRISSIANKIFKEDAKKWCDKYFYYEDNKSIHQCGNYTINEKVLYWLISKGYIKEKSSQLNENQYVGKGKEVKTYLSNEYYDEIKEAIINNKTVHLIGDCNIGKTILTAKLCKELNGIIMTPYNSMRDLYTKEGIQLIDGSNRKEFDYINSPGVMVTDQFGKIITNLKEYQIHNDDGTITKLKDIIKNKTIFFDEAHTLTNDTPYRDIMIELMNGGLNDFKKVFITATPLMECEMFKAGATLQYWKKRPTVNMQILKTTSQGQMKTTIEAITKKEYAMEKYDKILVCSNHSSRMIYDNFIYYWAGASDDVAILHNDYVNTGDLEYVIKNEKLNKKVTLATSLAFNGLNFNNENEDVLVIIEYIEYINNYANIIQALNRLRKSNVTCYIVWAPGNEDLYTEEKITDDVFWRELNIDTKLKSYNTIKANHPEYMKKFGEWVLENNTIQKTKDIIMNDYTYINLMEDDEIETKKYKKSSNELRKCIDGIILKLADKKSLTKNDLTHLKTGNKYFKVVINKLDDLMFNYEITRDEIVKLNRAQRIDSDNNCKYISLSTTINKLNRIINVCYETNERWNEIKEAIKNDRVSDIMFKSRMTWVKQIDEIRAKYKNIYFNDETGWNNSEIHNLINDLTIEAQIETDNKIKAKSEAGAKGGAKGGANGSPKKKVKDTETGIIYDSCEECANAIGKSKAYISKYKYRFIRIE